MISEFWPPISERMQFCYYKHPVHSSYCVGIENEHNRCLQLNLLASTVLQGHHDGAGKLSIVPAPTPVCSGFATELWVPQTSTRSKHISGPHRWEQKAKHLEFIHMWDQSLRQTQVRKAIFWLDGTAVTHCVLGSFELGCGPPGLLWGCSILVFLTARQQSPRPCWVAGVSGRLMLFHSVPHTSQTTQPSRWSFSKFFKLHDFWQQHNITQNWMSWLPESDSLGEMLFPQELLVTHPTGRKWEILKASSVKWEKGRGGKKTQLQTQHSEKAKTRASVHLTS